MNTQKVIGRKIVAVQQVRKQNDTGGPIYDVHRLDLDDGSMIVFNVLYDTNGESLVTGKWYAGRSQVKP